MFILYSGGHYVVIVVVVVVVFVIVIVTKPFCEAPLLDPAWSPMMFCPSRSKSSALISATWRTAPMDIPVHVRILIGYSNSAALARRVACSYI